MDQPPGRNVANSGVAHPIPGGIRMTTHRPSSADVPLPTPLTVQKLSPPQEDHKLLGEPWVNTSNLHPLPNPTGEMHPPTGRVILRWELLRSADAHPTHPGGGGMYLPTGRATMLRDSRRSTPHPHASPPGRIWPRGCPPHAPGERRDIFNNWSGAHAPVVSKERSPPSHFTP